MKTEQKIIRLSPRLESIARLVTPGNRVADIGTDHAYLPIRLCQEGGAPSAIAADLRAGPLKGALSHIRKAGLENRITVRQSDGLHAFASGEAETLILAGMGGKLICRILAEGRGLLHSFREILLQPQSDIADVRRFLMHYGFLIAAETCTNDEGKFYPVIRAVSGTGDTVRGTAENDAAQTTDEKEKRGGKPYTETELTYGPCLLRARDPLLKSWLEKKLQTTGRILQTLCARDQDSDSASVSARKTELKKEEQLLKTALHYYEM